jgi:hypothetical protein
MIRHRIFAGLLIGLMIFATSCSGSDPIIPETENKKSSQVEDTTDIDKNEKDSTQIIQPDDTVKNGITKNTDTNNEVDNEDADTDAVANEDMRPDIDYEKIRPDESGSIMVVMFHNFVETFKSNKYDNGDFTITLGEFERLLHILYEKNYRLINLCDYINNDISTAAGYIPMVFTFDDGTKGQFSLTASENGFTVNPKTAVGVMMKFNEIYPDFGLKGTFFINLGNNMFPGDGKLSERLNYLIEMGFEIGNHTLTHVQLNSVNDSETIIKEVGGNQKKMEELVPGYKMMSLSLPYGLPANELFEHLIKGRYQDVEYENHAILEVGWCPAPSPFTVEFNTFSINRVRAPGINPVDADLNWWISKLSRKDQFVSDGEPDIVTVPETKVDKINKESLGNRNLNIY